MKTTQEFVREWIQEAGISGVKMDSSERHIQDWPVQVLGSPWSIVWVAPCSETVTLAHVDDDGVRVGFNEEATGLKQRRLEIADPHCYEQLRAALIEETAAHVYLHSHCSECREIREASGRRRS